MPIIKPSRRFAGSEISSGDAGKYIKPEVRTVTFNKNSNKEGAYLYFLPAYKEVGGEGVWYKVIRVRDNFGDKFKDKYVVGDNDPTKHFERNFKLYYPEDAQPVDEMNDKVGRTMKRYPNYGRETTRVVFNVAYAQKLEAGCHILDLPAFNGANLLQKWLENKDSKGRVRPMVNDPDNCIPVFLKLNDGGGSPWQIDPDVTDPMKLPKQLSDTDYLYNLDDIFIKKTPDEIIARLKEMYTKEVFDRCIEGYAGYGEKAVTRSNPSRKADAEDEIDMTPSPAAKTAEKKVKSAPSLVNLPKANLSKETVDEENKEYATSERSPLSGMQNANLKDFLEN